MRHVDPDTLALIALGEPVGDVDERAHLAQCTQCADDVASLSATVSVARSVTADDAVVPAPPQVWDAVRAELGLPAELEPDGFAPAPARRQGGPGSRRWSTPWIAAAAAAGVVIGGAGGTLVARTLAEPTTTVVAQATLDPLPGWDAAGDAVVEETADGVFELVVNLEGGDDVGGYREVWLIDADVTRLVSLGVLVGSTGRFTLPPGVDLVEFPVVDISDEPFDGDPAHSGDSILRGLLDA